MRRTIEGGHDRGKLRMSQAAKAVPTASPVPRRAVAAVIVGNWLEFYDFIVYTFFAVMIGNAFFPAELMSADLSETERQFLSLLASLATFWAGFLTRPLGAIVIGAYGDRAGRKAAMTLTIVLMALGTGLLAIAPTYAQAGMAAPVILIIARLIQGFSCGGEVGPATTYLLEAAPSNRRASVTAWQGISQQMAGIMGSGLGLILTAVLSHDALYDWGWRVPFFVGILIGPVGLYIRRALPETIDKSEVHVSHVAVLKDLFVNNAGPILICVLCIIGPTISTYVSSYMTTYAIKTLKLSPEVGMLTTFCGYVAALFGVLLGAWSADRLGPKFVVLSSRVVFVLVVTQAYLLMTAQGATLQTLILVNIGLNFVLAIAQGGLYVLLTEAFPKAVRSSGVSIAYAISVTVFGGSTQLVIAWLIERLHDPMVPAWYQIGANIISIVAVLFVVAARESGRVAVAPAPGLRDTKGDFQPCERLPACRSGREQ